MATGKQTGTRFDFRRGGGSTVRFDAHVWQLTDPPRQVSTLQFKDFSKPAEAEVLALPAGNYRMIAIASVLEGVSPDYRYVLMIDDAVVAARDAAVADATPEADLEQYRHVHSFKVAS